MKRQTPMALLMLVLFTLFLALPAHAHPGKTDYRGGHTDNSTGEYHYHHGYPAHDHYDMDGDGKEDCPYDFEDRTDHSSGDSSNNHSESEYPATTASAEKEVKEVPSWVYWVFTGQAVVIVCLLIANSFKKDTIQTMESRQRYELDAVNKACETRIAEKNASDAELEAIHSNIADAKKIQKALLAEQDDLLGEISLLNREILKLRRVRCWAKAAPLDVSFSKNGKPVYWKPNISKPYGDYTVFISPKSNIYHTDHFCSGYHSKESHIFDVIGSFRPCRKCAEGFFDFTEAPDWYTGKETSVDEYPDSAMVNWRN